MADFIGVEYHEFVGPAFLSVSWFVTIAGSLQLLDHSVNVTNLPTAAVTGLLLCNLDNFPGVIRVRPSRHPRLINLNSPPDHIELESVPSFKFHDARHVGWANIDLKV